MSLSSNLGGFGVDLTVTGSGLNNQTYALSNSVDIRNFGALVNGVVLYDATMTQITGTTATMSAPDANFTQADVGKIASYLQIGSGAQPGR